MKRIRGGRSLAGPLVLLVLGLLQSGYVVQTLTPEQPIRWNGFPVRISIWKGFSGEIPSIVKGSRPRPALEAALESWVSVSSLAVSVRETPAGNWGRDGISLVTMADTPANRDLIGEIGGTLAVTALFYRDDGSILEADVVFDAARKWSTIETGDPDVVNLFDIAQHEFGHVWNLDHTFNRSSSMFVHGGTFGFGFNRLTWDDIAGINTTYPLLGLDRITGAIAGRVTSGDKAVAGAFVAAVDEHGVLAASAVSGPDGSYRISCLPPGDYSLYVEPLSGLMTPADLSSPLLQGLDAVLTDFFPQFYEGTAAPGVAVEGGRVAGEIDFAVSRGVPSLDPRFLAAREDGKFDRVLTTPAEGLLGRETHVMVGGRGMDLLQPEGGLFFLGELLEAGRAADDGLLSNGRPFKTYSVAVPESAPPGDYSIFLRSPLELGVVTGGLKLFSAQRFLQTFAQFAHDPELLSSSLLLLNTHSSLGASAQLSPRDSEGQAGAAAFKEAGPSVDLEPGGTTLIRTDGDEAFLGSLRVESGRFLGGTVLFETPFGVTGIGPGSPLLSFAAPVEVRGAGAAADTGLALTNLDPRPAQVFVRFQDAAGKALPDEASAITLDGHGHLAVFVRDLAPSPSLKEDFSGTVAVTANRKVAATVIRTSPGVLTTFPVLPNRLAGRSFYAQFAHAGDLSSELILINPSPDRTASEVKVQVRRSDGSPAAVVLNGESLATGEKTVSIPPLGLVSLRTGGAAVVGSVEVTSSMPVGGVVLFRSPSSGTTGVGESFPLERLALPLHRDPARGIDTGIALVNTQDQPVSLTLTVRDSGGEELDSGREIQLGPYQQFAVFADSEPLNLSFPRDFLGSLLIEATGPVAATVIRQSPSVLTTYPAVPVDQPVSVP